MTALSVATVVLVCLGMRDGYEWVVARCGEIEVYPEWGWFLFILPLALVGALCGGAAFRLNLNRSSAKGGLPWVLLGLSVLAGGAAAILSTLMLADPCGLGS